MPTVQHLIRGFPVVQLRGGAEDAIGDLGIDAVAIHTLDVLADQTEEAQTRPAERI
jgi:hypothetical protein